MATNDALFTDKHMWLKRKKYEIIWFYYKTN